MSSDTPESNYYEILGVAPSASAAEIKSAYRRLARLSHSDAGGTDGLFRILATAYETLSDSRRRSAYDQSLTKPTPDPAPQSSPSWERAQTQRPDSSRAGREYAGATTGENQFFYATTRPGAWPANRSKWRQPSIIAGLFASWWALRVSGLLAAVASSLDPSSEHWDKFNHFITHRIGAPVFVVATIVVFVIVYKKQKLHRPTLVQRLPRWLRPPARALIGGRLVAIGSPGSHTTIAVWVGVGVAIAALQLYLVSPYGSKTRVWLAIKSGNASWRLRRLVRR